MTSQQDTFNLLCAYTLSRADAEFIHQHALDAFTAQTADDQTTTVRVTFALAGLCLLVEHGYSGRQVQRAHSELARQSKTWPSIALPNARGLMTVTDVLAEREGPDRDRAIRNWCESVWNAYAEIHIEITNVLKRYNILR